MSLGFGGGRTESEAHVFRVVFAGIWSAFFEEELQVAFGVGVHLQQQQTAQDSA